MNLKLFAVLSALALASSASVTSAASTDGSISAEEAAIPACNQTELVYVAEQMTTNNRKKFCESTLGLKEMVRATDTKALCDNPSCKVALEDLYLKLPNCKYLDWGIRYTTGRLLEFCGTNLDDLINADPAKYVDIPAPTNATSGSDKKETVNWTDSSSSGSPTFAPIGAAPTPVPTQTAAQQVTPATAAPKSAAVSSVAVVSSAAALVAAAASLAL